MKKVMVVFGTRPEAIKMAPVIRALRSTSGIDTRVLVTAQHRQMLDQALKLFDIQPDVDLDLMRPGQDLNSLFAAVLGGVGKAIEADRPDRVLVHGDTTTTLATAVAAFHARVPVGHVEAGLRTGNLQAPWPEEANRRLVSPLADLHFAPTEGARENLLREGIRSDAIAVTGNTVIDALLWAVAALANDPALRSDCASRFPFLDSGRRLVLVTGHRRENFGESLESICNALCQLAVRDDIQIIYPVHLNPNVLPPVERLLSGVPNIHLVAPQEYLPFAYLMQRSALIVTDSGGIQEEAPALGKPVLVTREITERPEAVTAGTALLVGTSAVRIVSTANLLLDDDAAYRAMAHAPNPFGDGLAAARIARILAS